MKNYLDWRAYQDAGMGDPYADIPKNGGDFAKAVAACINSRQCETHGKQVMCPSFRVTNNPNFSTGGRVKLLKAALSCDSSELALLDPMLSEAMDLCVSCKGCKRECEANVDMALIKAEYKAQKVACDGLGFRDRLFAYAPHWLHNSQWIRHLIKYRNRYRFLRWISDCVFGIATSQLLPQPVRVPFSDDKSYNSELVSGKTNQNVVLFVDTFTRYFEPNIAYSAIAVLEAAGYRVHVAKPILETPDPSRPLCCGRTFLAQGLVELARNEVRRVLYSLNSYVDAGYTIIGLEASCIIGLRDDSRALGLGREIDKLSKNLVLFEEFLSKEITSKRFSLPLRSMKKTRSLVHGHCHQKAVGATKAVRRVLKHVPDHEFKMIDAGCCGMAGTFGLETEHAKVSSQMAEDGLIPALQNSHDATIICNGFSCRQQIKNLSSHRPCHLVEFLHDAIIT